VTVNAYRPGGVDTAMQARTLDPNPADIGHGLHGQFVERHAAGELITPQVSAAARVGSDATGEVWEVADGIPAS
jgi:hypothetical protein